MKKNELDKDLGLRLAVQRKTEASERMILSENFTDRLMQRIEQQDEQPSDNEQQPKHRRMWLYPAIGAVAASIALLMVIHLGQNTGEQPSLMAQTDTTQTVIKKVEELPLPKEKNIEMTDTVKIIKEQLRMARTPRHYMAKAEPAEVTPKPEAINEIELSERAIAEEKRQMEMEMMAQMSGSLQADFKALTDEIRSRGERMSQQVEIAMSNEE